MTLLIFAGVLLGCADREQTWINGPIEAAMLALHARAQAHSVEVWLDGELVGGTYGVVLGRAFFAESMFSRARDASTHHNTKFNVVSHSLVLSLVPV